MTDHLPIVLPWLYSGLYQGPEIPELLNIPVQWSKDFTRSKGELPVLLGPAAEFCGPDKTERWHFKVVTDQLILQMVCFMVGLHLI